MALVRTQIYLEPEQHRLLKEEAHRRGTSLAQLLRALVDEGMGLAPADHAGGDLSALAGIGDSASHGASGGSDVSRYKDAYLAEALRDAGKTAGAAPSTQPNRTA
jgi:hypothetical protein